MLRLRRHRQNRGRRSTLRLYRKKSKRSRCPTQAFFWLEWATSNFQAEIGRRRRHANALAKRCQPRFVIPSEARDLLFAGIITDARKQQVPRFARDDKSELTSKRKRTPQKSVLLLPSIFYCGGLCGATGCAAGDAFKSVRGATFGTIGAF